MMGFLLYDLKVAVLIAVFYMFYRLLLSRDTLHCMNRLVLLTTALASFVLPFCVITMHKTVVVPMATIDMGVSLASVATEPDEGAPWWQWALPVLNIIGMVATLAYVLVSILKIWLLIKNSEQHPQADGITICVTGNADVSPCSWMHYIIMNRSDYNRRDAAILAHERGHIRQHHSLDVLLADTLTALQWFNPAMWMLRQDLRAIHEYEADAAVLSQGINMRQYQYLLIQKAAATGGYSVANGITHSTLKNRIIMMLNNKKSTRKSWLKLLALIPIVGVTLALNAETVTEYVYQQPPKKAVKKGYKDGKVKMNTKTLEVKADTATMKGANVSVLLMEKKDNLANPLIIVDGKRIDNPDEFFKDFERKNIDHVDVLKEKSAVDLYGEEGKNGVIIITTKKKSPSELSEVTVNSYASNDNSVETEYDKVFDVVEEMPEFPGGQEALSKFLAENVCYPEAALKSGVQGRVVVSFIINAEGRINNVKVVKKVSDDLDAEAIRLVGAMPKWNPGRQNGMAVRVKYVVPITFRLN